MQGPLQKELTEGVASFNADVLKFDADYDAFGPMSPGLTAREASDRLILSTSAHFIFNHKGMIQRIARCRKCEGIVRA